MRRGAAALCLEAEVRLWRLCSGSLEYTLQTHWLIRIYTRVRKILWASVEERFSMKPGQKTQPGGETCSGVRSQLV